jgi:phage terminase Nu1 subunit (DNA packaging protein)
MASWGGARPNSGPKPAGYEHPEGRADFEKERAEHERIKREQRQLKLDIERGLYLRRDAVRQASATAQAVMAQSLLSLPDNLERQFSLAPEVVVAITGEIDGVLQDLAKAMKAMAGDE